MLNQRANLFGCEVAKFQSRATSDVIFRCTKVGIVTSRLLRPLITVAVLWRPVFHARMNLLTV